MDDSESTGITGYNYKDEDDSLILGIQILSGIALFVVMFALGCMTCFREARERLKKPVGAVIGAMAQFALMSLLGFGCVHIFSLDEDTAIGGVVLAACPGVFVSILFTTWMRADLLLSVCMTAIFSLLAIGFTPLNIFIYTRTWTGPASFIPYGLVIAVIIIMLVPAAFGALLRWKVGNKMEVVGKVLFPVSVLLSIIILMLVIIADSDLVFGDWRPWILAWLYPLFALIIGYLAGFTACLTHPQCRTIAVETACQNVALSIAIISITFPKERVLPMLIVPVLYEVFMYINCFLMLALYRCCIYAREPKEEDTRQIFRASSAAGSISTVHTGVTMGSITTVLPPGSYVNNALDLHNSFNKSFAPVVRFDPDTFDIGDKYGHQSVQTPHPDESGGFEEAGFRVLTAKKYRPYREETELQDPGRNAEPAIIYPDQHDMGTGDPSPMKPETRHSPEIIPAAGGRYLPPPIRESTPVRAQDNVYDNEPTKPNPGYTNYAVDDEAPPERPPLPAVSMYRPPPADHARQRRPLEREFDNVGDPHYEPVDDLPKQQVTLDPRRDIHSNDYRNYVPNDEAIPTVSGYYRDQEQHPNGDVNATGDVTESEV